MTLSDIAARITGEALIAKDTGNPAPPSQSEIAQLAYQYYETRGRQDGHDVDDWLTAEQALSHGR